MKYLISIFIIFSFIFTFAPSSYAKTIGIFPAYVDITLKSDKDEQSFDLYVKNKTDKAIKLDVSSLDFKQDDPYGSVAFLGKNLGNYTYSLSSFLTYDKNSFVLPSGKQERIVVTVKNREDLSPGGHYAAVIVRQTPPDGNKETVVSPALSSLIYLRKTGGERFNLSLKDINFPKLPIVFNYPNTYLLTMQNDGNVHLVPYGRADIKDMFGRMIFKGVINEGSLKVLPQSRRYIPVYSKKVEFSFPISINTLNLEGRDSIDKTKFSYTEVFIYINPVFAIALLGLVILIIIGIMRKKRPQSNKK